MSDGFNAKDQAGNAVPILMDEVTDGTLGTAQKQLVGIVDATINGTNKMAVDSSGRIAITKGIGAGQTLLFASIDNSAASGNTTIVAAVTAKRIYVVSYSLVCANAVTAQWKSSGGTALSGAMSFGVNGGIVMASLAEAPLFPTVSGEGLVLTAGGAVSITGHLSYFAV